MHEDEPCGCMLNAWNAKWAGTMESFLDCIPNRMHIDRYSKFNSVRLFVKLPAQQLFNQHTFRAHKGGGLMTSLAPFCTGAVPILWPF